MSEPLILGKEVGVLLDLSVVSSSLYSCSIAFLKTATHKHVHCRIYADGTNCNSQFSKLEVVPSSVKQVCFVCVYTSTSVSFMCVLVSGRQIKSDLACDEITFPSHAGTTDLLFFLLMVCVTPSASHSQWLKTKQYSARKARDSKSTLTPSTSIDGIVEQTVSSVSGSLDQKPGFSQQLQQMQLPVTQPNAATASPPLQQQQPVNAPLATTLHPQQHASDQVSADAHSSGVDAASLPSSSRMRNAVLLAAKYKASKEKKQESSSSSSSNPAKPVVVEGTTQEGNMQNVYSAPRKSRANAEEASFLVPP